MTNNKIEELRKEVQDIFSEINGLLMKQELDLKNQEVCVNRLKKSNRKLKEILEA